MSKYPPALRDAEGRWNALVVYFLTPGVNTQLVGANEIKTAQDGLAREETNLASYTDQLARPFEHGEALLFAQRDLARIDRKLTHHSGSSGPPAPPCINAALDDEAAA